MITKLEWLEKVQDPRLCVGTLDLTLYNSMYGSLHTIKGWLQSENSVALSGFDNSLVQWQTSFWGILPPEQEHRRKVASAWARCMELILDLHLPYSANFLHMKREERLYLYDLSKGRDLLGQYYQIMRQYRFDMYRHWQALAVTELDVPLVHRETALMAILESGDIGLLEEVTREMISVLTSQIRGPSEKRNTEIFIRSVLTMISSISPGFTERVTR